MSRLLLLLGLLLAAWPAHAADHWLQPVQATCPPHAADEPWSCIAVTDTTVLADLPAGWHLLIDRSRFRAIRVEVVQQNGGTYRIDRAASDLATNWTLGNNLRFDVPVAGRDVRMVRVAFAGVDSLSLVRSVRALSPRSFAHHEQRWTGLVLLVTGILVCSLAYNLFLLTWLRTDFQHWYVVWVAGALAYTLCWTGMVAHLMPWLAGPTGTRLNYLLVGLIVASGTSFFFALIEEGRMPPRLTVAGRWCATAVLASAIVAGLDTVVPAMVGDRALNIAFIACTIVVAVGIVVAIRRGSRAVWFYLAGWAPALVVFELRVARNFGLVPKSEAVDMASFAAIAFEAVALSLAIADRYRRLARDRDVAEAERAALERLALTDPLTGLGNRTAFQARLAALPSRAQAADLVLLDLDRLKQVNDSAGHDAGDALIAEAGRRLREAAGEGAMVARIGGDEFAVLFEGRGDSGLAALLRLIEAEDGAPFKHSGRAFELSFSAGHAPWTNGMGDAGWLYKKADLALYRAKAEGRGRWRSHRAA